MKTSELIVTQLGEADVEAVAALEATAFSTPWSADQYRSVIRHGGCTLFGARAEGVLVGYIAVAVCPASREMEVYNIAVAAAYKRRGIGKKLLSLAVRAACKNGIERVFLEVRENNEPALALYRTLGFVCAGVRPHYYPDTGEDALVMVWDGTGTRHP